jgi:hypothetical protein
MQNCSEQGNTSIMHCTVQNRKVNGNQNPKKKECAQSSHYNIYL